MPQALGLIAPPSCTQERIVEILGLLWRVDYLTEESGKLNVQIQVDDENGTLAYVSISEIDPSWVAEDYETREDLTTEIRGIINKSRIYSIAFNDYFLIKKVIIFLLRNSLNYIELCIIDDDYGRLIPAKEFLTRLESEPSWDWRQAPT